MLDNSFTKIIELIENRKNNAYRKVNEEDDFPNTRILDTYSLEFLDLPKKFSEKDLKTSIIKNLLSSHLKCCSNTANCI